MNIILLLISAAFPPVSTLLAVSLLVQDSSVSEAGDFFFTMASYRIVSSWAVGGLINRYIGMTTQKEVFFDILLWFFFVVFVESLLVFYTFSFFEFFSNLAVTHFISALFVLGFSVEMMLVSLLRRAGVGLGVFLPIAVSCTVFLCFAYTCDLTAGVLILLLILRNVVAIILLLMFTSRDMNVYVSSRGKIDSSEYRYRTLIEFKILDFFRSFSGNYDKHLVSFVSGQSLLGLYGAVQQFTNIPTLAMAAIANIFFPRVVDRLRDGRTDSNVVASCIFYWMLLSPLLIIFLYVGIYYLGFLSAFPSFTDVGVLFAILGAAGFIFTPFLFCASLVSQAGGARYMLWVSMGATLAGGVSASVLFSSTGIYAFAVGFFATNAILSVGAVHRFCILYRVDRLVSIKQCLYLARSIFV